MDVIYPDTRRVMQSIQEMPYKKNCFHFKVRNTLGNASECVNETELRDLLVHSTMQNSSKTTGFSKCGRVLRGNGIIPVLIVHLFCMITLFRVNTYNDSLV